MTMSKRERYVGIAAAAVVGLLLVDQVLVTPLLARWTSADERIELATIERNGADDLIFASERANRQWSSMIGGQLQRDASEAESQVLSSVREWAQEAGMTLSSLKPERTEKEKDFYKITFRATGGGGMSQIGRFLHRLETASVPVRVTDVTITSRKSGTDELGIQLGIATSYLAPEAADKLPRATTATASREVQR
jgi:hypothetical protein